MIRPGTGARSGGGQARARLIRKLAWWLAALHLGCAAAADGTAPWVLPHDPGAATRNADEYAWRLFVALNWPVDPATGAADATRRLGDAGPVVWESWANARAIFRSDGADPGPWPAGGRSAGAAPADRFDGLPLDPATPTKHIVDGRMTLVTDPVAAASHLDETRMSRASYDYIRRQRLYDLDGQRAAYLTGRTLTFPSDSRHVKAQWEPIDASQRGRYFWREIVLADGRRRLYGLTALHIATKDLPDWFWATFEHVDSAPAGAASAPPRSSDTVACAGRAPGCNAAPGGIGLEGTVWQHYRLRGTMTSFVDAAGRPRLLGNTRLESGVRQDSASCITCHARATIATEKGRVVRLPLFDDRGAGDAVAAPQVTGPRRGFVGLPQAAWYAGPGEAPGRGYARTDFVWSLDKAHAASAASTGSR